MHEHPWRIAVLDSGVGPALMPRVRRMARFVDEGKQVRQCAPVEDPLGHGSLVAGIIASAARPLELLIAQVLNERGRCTAATLAAAVDWAMTHGAELVHVSLGLPQDRAVLAAAVAASRTSGALLVAAAPARGLTTYPASYPGVFRATGDARCGGEQISFLNSANADFGACPVHEGPAGKVSRGASVGAAHLSRYIVTHVANGLSPWHVYQNLMQEAVFQGPERHYPAARG